MYQSAVQSTLTKIINIYIFFKFTANCYVVLSRLLLPRLVIVISVLDIILVYSFTDMMCIFKFTEIIVSYSHLIIDKLNSNVDLDYSRLGLIKPFIHTVIVLSCICSLPYIYLNKRFIKQFHIIVYQCDLLLSTGPPDVAWRANCTNISRHITNISHFFIQKILNIDGIWTRTSSYHSYLFKAVQH